jgi:signal transduction histidine kinase
LRECNETSAEILGFPNADVVVGLNLEEILKNRGESGVKALRQFILSNYYLHEVETSNEEEGEQKRYFRINFVGTVENGKLIRAWGTQREITTSKRAELQLAEYSEQLRALSARVNLAREEEGARIAREIHDELGTALTGLRWDLEWIEKKLEASGDRALVQPIREKLASTNKLIGNTVETVRRIASELRPKLLDDLGLITAIEWQAQQVKQRAGLDFAFDSQVEEIDLGQEKATAVFRIFQEVLTNVLRHANASRVEVKIKVADDSFVLKVKDNGRGITRTEQTKKKSLGLLGMRERASLVGGSVAIMGQEGKGTTVIVRVPIGE